MNEVDYISSPLEQLQGLYDRIEALEAENGLLRGERDRAEARLTNQAAELHRLQAVEAEYDRLKQRARSMEVAIDRLERRARGEGDWECSNCGKPLQTVTQWEQHECLTTETVFNGLVGRYKMVDPELIVDWLMGHGTAEREEIFAFLVKIRPLIEKNFHEPSVSLELNHYEFAPSTSYVDQMKRVTFDVAINPQEHPAEAFRNINNLMGAVRELPGFKEQHKVDISVKYEPTRY
jgi:hypothetical protein